MTKKIQMVRHYKAHNTMVIKLMKNFLTIRKIISMNMSLLHSSSECILEKKYV